MKAWRSRDHWIRERLEADGFVGWVRFAELEQQLQTIPRTSAGVYLLFRPGSGELPEWAIPSPVGETWRGDPSVSVTQLEANWVRGAEVLYIGKAKDGQLRNRLRAYLRFGQGRAGRHWGGRLVFQLPDAWDLLVAWREEPEEDALAVEGRLLGEFREAHDGSPPFANNPDRLGR